MTNPLIPEVVRLKGGLRAYYISHELASSAALQRIKPSTPMKGTASDERTTQTIASPHTAANAHDC